MTDDPTQQSLARCLREVAEFVDSRGWDQPPQIFALVPTAELAAAEPALLDQLDDSDALTPIAQDPFPDDIGGGSHALDEFLATTSWPEAVVGCLLAQQIVVLPPDAESDLDEALGPLLADPDAADEAGRAAADAHPDRRTARLFAGVLRDGTSLCLMQLRPLDDEDDDGFGGGEPELLSYPDLGSNLIEALQATLEGE
ncbi:PPA1309 family protein [Aldersonia kunmingensis]|uniref:PPA1309 family protein n=1 Tax=Aldersonia kunmingensis TaxID=408066 RepID=UPI00082DC048|nr:PPA1309 family protein [Aldersonia kunmingensis]